MAGPLRWFRKYEKILLGVFGVALMIAFTFSLGVSSVDLLGQLAGTAQGPGGGGGGPNDSGDPVVASWTGGDYRESDFRDLEQATSPYCLHETVDWYGSATRRSAARPGHSTICR